MSALSPPPGFVDTPHPPVAGPEKLVTHVEEIVIDRPFAQVVACVDATPLADWVAGTDALPGVVGTHMLKGDVFDAPGSRHMVFLSDGTTVVEQVLQKTRTETSYHFNYVVWGYVTKAARPLKYGFGDFLYTDAGAGRTHVRWTYAFELRGDRFPGFLGPLGGFLLKKTFLEGPYAQWMAAGLRRIKANCEGANG